MRPAESRDARAAIAATRDAAEELPRSILSSRAELYSVREWRRRRQDWGPAGATLVAEVDGVVVGSLSVFREPRPPMRHSAEIGLTVARAARGMAVGRALMLAAEEWARAHGVERLSLSVFPHNERALRLYRALGFVVEGTAARVVRFPEGDLDLVLMAKWIARAH